MQLKSWGIIAGIATIGMMAGGSFDRAGAVVLYNGTGTPNGGSNPYLTFFSPTIGVPSANPSGGVTLNTSSSELSQAGYANYTPLGALVNSSFPVLDNNTGYTLSFQVKINAQTNNGTNGANRAGFSVIVLGSDKKGIEIGFRNPNTQGGGTTPDVFSQAFSLANPFTVGEQNASLSGILNQLNTYDLTVLNNTYTLKNGSTTLITGALRDYTAAAVANTPTAVYALSNFLFLGDDTTSAGASVDIQSITLTTNNATAIPEPSNLLGIGLTIGIGTMLKGRLSKIGRNVNKLSR
jgi:hypothetical protein